MDHGEIEAATEAGNAVEVLRAAQRKAARLLDATSSPGEYARTWATYADITARLDKLTGRQFTGM